MIKLYYQEKGKGEPFVLLHGNNSSSEYFKKQIEYFSSKYRVIAVDTRGHGKSPRGEKPFNMNQFSKIESESIKDLIPLIELFGVDKILDIAKKCQKINISRRKYRKKRIKI